MKREVNKLDTLKSIIPQITEKSQKNLFVSANRLLKVQNEDKAVMKRTAVESNPTLTIKEVETINKRFKTEKNEDIKLEIMDAVIILKQYAVMTNEKDNGNNAV